jgi:hypothetical protein
MLSSVLFAALIGAGQVVIPVNPGQVFVTKAQGNGNLGSWAEAGGKTGIAAGDAICVSEATQANLVGPSAYIAALSDSNNDLYCRLHGLSGKVATNCGQPNLPAYAGPWQRVDGNPFATLNTFLNSSVTLTPASIHADRTSAENDLFFQGTAAGMVYDSTNGACSDWTSGASSTVAANAAGSIYFTGSTSNCLGGASLLCLQAGQNVPFNKGFPSGRLAFTTTSSGNGDLSTWTNAAGETGILAADQVCKAEAAAHSLTAPGSFKAWISDSTQSINAIDRFQNDGPWVRIDGIVIASSKAALTDPTRIVSAPSISSSGSIVLGEVVLTGTDNEGHYVTGNDDCMGWTSASTTDAFPWGRSDSISYWSSEDAFTTGCNTSSNRLYCFSDLDLIFDGKFDAIPY